MSSVASTRIDPRVDSFHGHEIREDFRWLEDQTDLEVRDWVETQNDFTKTFLDGTGIRAESRRRMSATLNREERTKPTIVGGKRFELRKQANQEQYSLWVINAGAEVLLIDANTLDPAGKVAITDFFPSPDGTMVAWARAERGSDWMVVSVRDVATGEDRIDKLEWIKWAQAAWLPDSSGFYYLGFDVPAAGDELLSANSGQQIRFHKIGTSQKTDPAVYAKPGAQWLTCHLDADGKYLNVVSIDGTTPTHIASLDLGKPLEGFRTVVAGEEKVTFLACQGDELFYASFAENPEGRILRLKLDDAVATPVEVPLSPGFVEAESSIVTKNFLVTSYSSCSPQKLVRTHLETGAITPIELPEHATVSSLVAVPGTDTVLAMVSSWTVGGGLWSIDVGTGDKTRLFTSPNDAERKVEWLETASADGTQVPLALIGMSVEKSEPRPTLLVAYGGYGVDFLSFGLEDWHQVWLDAGGYIALAGIRGGAEFGEDWHRGAMRADKQRGFDDFLACAEFLIDEGWTTAEQLGINGMSNGGLLMGVAMTQRPDLFGAVVAEVGVMDMLRFHQYTVGAGWIREFGNPDEPEDFAYIHAYSPLHQLKKDVSYPATLVVTGDHDDRVPPGVHSYKFTARLQQVHKGNEPILLRVQPDSGHGTGKSTSARIEERADITAFLAHQLGLSLS